MKCSEIIEILEELAPERLACDWDNSGLLAGRGEKEVRKILLTVDVDDRALETAVREGADLIISHHPLIFKAVKQITDRDFIGRRLVSMIQADIAYYAMHTNFDAAPGCMADVVSEKLGIADGTPLEALGELDGGTPYGIGKVGMLSTPAKGMELARKVKGLFGLPFVTVYGRDLWEEEPVRLAAVCPGSGGSVIGCALKGKAQVLVTGDIGHHQGIDAAAQGLMIIDAGHYGLEHIFMDYIEQYLNHRLGCGVEIQKMPVCFPAVVI